jgi:hypothetical protein
VNRREARQRKRKEKEGKGREWEGTVLRKVRESEMNWEVKWGVK